MHIFLFSGLHLHSQGFTAIAIPPASKSLPFWEFPHIIMLRNKSVHTLLLPMSAINKPPEGGVWTPPQRSSLRTLHSGATVLCDMPVQPWLDPRWPSCTVGGRWLLHQANTQTSKPMLPAGQGYNIPHKWPFLFCCLPPPLLESDQQTQKGMLCPHQCQCTNAWGARAGLGCVQTRGWWANRTGVRDGHGGR